MRKIFTCLALLSASIVPVTAAVVENDTTDISLSLLYTLC
jgi:hypothetical protein